MGDRTGIAWTDATWNPVRGCSRVSEGCRFCYAEKDAARFSGPGLPYEGFADRSRSGSKWTGRVEVVWPLIDLPIRWRRARRIFVNSMSDLFHEALPIDEIANIFAVMVAAHQVRRHTFQVLTKRPDRMAEILNRDEFWDHVNVEASMHVMEYVDPHDRRSDDARATLDDYGSANPPPGIWLGTSVENQPAAAERIPHLLATSAALRFLSCEPLLGPVLIGPPVTRALFAGGIARSTYGHGMAPIAWAIIGGESGLGARPMRPEWAASLISQCRTAGIAPFFKQIGSAHDLWPSGVTGKGDDPEQWPEMFRLQEFPE